MATVQLSKSFDFASDQDWDWEVTAASASSITISNGIYKQTIAGSFSFDATGMPSGTVSTTTFFINDQEVYRVTDMAHDATRIAQFAQTEGDTQQTYAFVFSGNGFTVVDKTGAEGTDTLSGVERLVFADGGVALDVDASSLGGQAYRIYKAAFARTPDSGGVGFWMSALDKGMSLVDIATGFIASDEYKTAYGTNLSNRALITKYYENILGRAPEQGGLDFWVGVLDNKQASVAQVLASISESGENITGTAALIANGFEFTPYG